MVFVCPPDHRHGEVGTCYTAHKCRCGPCRLNRSKSAARYRAGLRDSLDWAVVVEEVEHFVSLGETGLICQQLFTGMSAANVRISFERVGRLDVYDKVKDYLWSEAWS